MIAKETFTLMQLKISQMKTHKFPSVFKTINQWINFKSEFLNKITFTRHGYVANFEYFIYSTNRDLWNDLYINPVKF